MVAMKVILSLPELVAGGGVGIYVPYRLEYSYINSLTHMTETLESLFIEVEMQTSRNVIIGVIYRPPHCPHGDFLTDIHNILHSPKIQNKYCFIMGDFNVNLL